MGEIWNYIDWLQGNTNQCDKNFWQKESTAKRHPLAKRGKLYSVCSDHELFLEFNVTPDKT